MTELEAVFCDTNAVQAFFLELLIQPRMGSPSIVVGPFSGGAEMMPAVATFNDVPTNHLFFQFIEALAARGSQEVVTLQELRPATARMIQ